MNIFTVQPGGHLSGHVRVPGDKSISHRAIMLGALAEGETRVTGFLEGADCIATLEAFRAMGVEIERLGPGDVRIRGVGLRGLRVPTAPLDMGNSGTAMRLMCGVLAGQPFDTELVGDRSLTGRPMRRVTDPLARMGARITTSETGTPPLRVQGGAPLRGTDHVLQVASAQVKSALLLAGLWADGRTCVTEPAPTRDHTERMLAGFGYSVERDGPQACLEGGGVLTASPVDVPADISSAAFFLVGASIASGSRMRLQHVGINPTRTGVIDILRLMGARIDVLDAREAGGEPVADLEVEASQLQGIAIPEELVPLAIDEFPAIFVAAACASGETVLTGAEELRVKESDRIQVMADGLAALGINCTVLPDGIRIQGRGAFEGGEIDSHGDHRIAMAFAMAGLRARGPIRIRDCANVGTSFPGFVELSKAAGLQVEAA
ncbi:3-phosphoshikimate 1-carboxyvinyltransferase [Thioalkalivibrio sp. ALJ16]|uniref:3-phosphoshikimate 1-carboxyvinyltransferase n=1 Tax=Thioalkalivibrio sp. ALJ16 TaxID=1158762 RepID=UPI00036EBEBF|nr:3-phosphoshikimate 1-carboxyvinyltransferase [Thioalkalivibrio sp. ALJ16]